MSLDLANGSAADFIGHGSDASIGGWTTKACAAWFFPDTAPSSQLFRICGKEDATTGNGWYMAFAEHSALSIPAQGIRLFHNRATTNMEAIPSGANFITLNAWNFIAVTMDATNGPKIYHGDLTTAPTEASYGTQTTGSGAMEDDTGDTFRTGNGGATPAAARGLKGRVACMVYDEAEWSLNDVEALWLNWGMVAGGMSSGIFVHYGYPGTGTQADWSGNGNDGTITANDSVTEAAHPPLNHPFWSPTEWHGFAAAAGGGWGPLLHGGRNRLVVGAG